jgi:hypothetical protein
MNRLYFGDNLKWPSDRKEFPDASVDLVYLDPRLIRIAAIGLRGEKSEPSTKKEHPGEWLEDLRAPR